MSNREYIIYICMVQKYTLKARALHCIAQKIYTLDPAEISVQPIELTSSK